MLEVSNVNVYDLKESVIASGNAMRLHPVEYTDEEFEKGLVRMKRLVNASKSGNIRCHDNALVGIRVSFDVKYPGYWTPEAQRYHFLDIVTSASKMHRLCEMDVKYSCNEYTDPRSIAVLQEKIDAYKAIKDNEWTKTSPKYKAFMEMVSSCPMGVELFERLSTNYKQLQTIYYQRRNHKLLDDWGAFCDMIESLPYFHELILGE